MTLTHKGVGEGDEGLPQIRMSPLPASEFVPDSSKPATPHRRTILPDDAKLRKQFPLATGCMEYFPNALLAVSHQSWLGNQQHHPDKPLHWDKNKSADEKDAGARHSVEGDLVAKAWRSLAELERALLAGYKPWAYLNTPKDGN